MEVAEHFKKCVTDGTLSHAYLLWGYGDDALRVRCAEDVARLLEPEPFSDCMVVRPQDGSISIGMAREASRFLWVRPARSARRMVIVTDAGACTDEAQNALLKTVEEPPPHGLIIFVARDPSLLVPALQSRVQKLYVPQTDVSDIAQEDVDCAVAYLRGPAAIRKDIIKKLIEAEDVPSFDRFAAAVMAHLARDSQKNWQVLKELSYRITVMAAHPTNRRLQWDAVSSYL